MFGLSKLQTLFIAIGFGVVITLGGIIYFQNSVIEDKNDRITRIQAELTAEEVAHQVTVNSFEETTAKLEEVQDALNTLNRRFFVINEENQELQSKLARHDLEALSAARPQLIENRINNATRDVADRIRRITGGTQQ